MSAQRSPHRRLWLAAVLVALAALAVQLNRTQLWEDRQVHAGWHVQQHIWLGTCRLLDPARRLQAAGRPGDCAGALAQRVDEGRAPQGRHLVLMLHGMGRSPLIFRDMERDLRAAGYDAAAISYPSLTKDIAGHADQVERLLDRAEGVDTVSFVTHSLGGLVVRELLNREGPWRDRLALGRVVMIAPPNQGSALAGTLAVLPPYHWIGGPSASQIAAGPPFAEMPAEVEVAVIAGGTAGGAATTRCCPGMMTASLPWRKRRCPVRMHRSSCLRRTRSLPPRRRPLPRRAVFWRADGCADAPSLFRSCLATAGVDPDHV